MSLLTRAIRAFSQRALLLLMIVALPGAVVAAESDRTNDPVVGVFAKTPLLQLDRKQASTLAISQVGRKPVPLRVVVSFFDADGKRLAVQRGRLGTGKASYVARLAHDDIAALDATLVRAEVAIVPTRPRTADSNWTVAISQQSSSGGAFGLSAGPPTCGPSQGGSIFADCISISDLVAGQ